MLKRLNFKEQSPSPSPRKFLGRAKALCQQGLGPGLLQFRWLRKKRERSQDMLAITCNVFFPPLPFFPNSYLLLFSFQETSLCSSQVTTMTWMKPCPPSFRYQLLAPPRGGWAWEADHPPPNVVSWLSWAWEKRLLPHPPLASSSVCLDPAPHQTPSNSFFLLLNRTEI